MSKGLIDPLLVGLAARRESLGLTQTDLAKLISQTRSSVHNIESGATTPHFRTLRKILDVLGLDVQLTEISVEKQVAYLKSLSAEDLELELLRRRWYVHPNDLVGGFSIMPIDAPPSSGCFSIGDFGSLASATHIVEAHNLKINKRKATVSRSSE